MELMWLEDFVALAGSGTFSRAATARHVTQPAFSRRVRALERWVGTPLFVRSVRGAALTPAGEQFLRTAPDLVRTIAQARQDARDAGGREGATLRFAATHALSFTFFPGWIRGAEEQLAIGPVQLVSDSMQGCEELMLRGEAQFLLCHRHALAPVRLEARQFRSIPVGRDALIPLTAPDENGTPRWQLDRNDGPIPLLAYTGASGLGRIVAAHGFADRHERLTPVFAAHLATTLLGMAREGRGVAWLPAGVAAPDLANGTVTRAGSETWDIAVDIHLFRPIGRQSAAAERFWAALPR